MDIQVALNVANLLWVYFLARQDIKRRQLNKTLLFGFIIVVFMIRVFWSSISDIIIIVFPGILLILMAFLTNEKIGYGDGLTLLGIGLCTTFRFLCAVLFFSMMSVAVASLFLVIYFSKSKNINIREIRIPFVPFLLLGVVMSYVW